MELTSEQLEAYHRIPSKGWICLEGRAGTGKTTVAAKWIADNCRKYNIAVCAPTNKAVGVIRKKVGPSYATYCTIHSLLGLREHIDPDTGKITFKRKNNSVSKAGDFDIIFVDECSMVNEELFGYIHDEVDNCIFVGDINQIPPVGEDLSLTFSGAKITLKTIMRQEGDSDIIPCSIKLDTFTKGKGVFPINDAQFTSHIKMVFNQEQSKSDLDFAKVVAWRNEEVDYWNKLIRSYLFGDEINKVVPGDRLIASKPIYATADQILYHTNDEFTVVSVETHEENLGNDTTPLIFKYYYARTQFTDFDGEMQTRVIKVIHESSEKAYNETLEMLKGIALKAPPYNKSIAWREYFKLAEWYARVSYCWAITAHKSQGSTYRNCFLVARDIRKNREFAHRSKIMYTAMTRASTNLFILN